MNISRYKCAYCVNGNPHFYTILLERKRDYFLRNNVPNFSNSILLYLLFPKHWRNIHIYLIRSTHKTYMVAPSLKLNTTVVTRVIDEHLEFPHLHIWYDGLSHFMKTKNNLWVLQMLGRKEIQSSLQSTNRFGSLLCRWTATHSTTHIDLLLFACLHTWLCFHFKAP